MDVSRAVLDNLMGRDRNKPNDKITQRDHYSNPDVCKSFLVCFCFNTLFPNTTYDQGPCQKRHDTYLKNMFDNDPNRAQYERQYIKQCIHWIQRRLQDVEKKTKQNQSVIENKSNFPTDRPKQILDRILVIQDDIQRLITQSQKYGQEGKIDDSVRCLQQVQKLRQRRKQIQALGSDMTNAQKQQKICLICGAIQTINDTQKRIQTHLQGKIHQGFLKLRHEVQILRIRLQVLNKMNPQQKKEQKHAESKAIRLQQTKQRQNKQNRQNISHNNNRIERQKSSSPKRKKDKKSRSKSKQRKQKPHQRQRQRQRQRQKDKQRQRHHSRQKQRDRQRQRQRQRDRDKQHKQRQRQRSRQRRQKKNHRDSRQKQHKQKQRHHKQHKQHKQHKDHKKKHKKNRSKSREKDDKSSY